MDVKITSFPEGDEDPLLWVLEYKGVVVCVSGRDYHWTAYVAGTTYEARETYELLKNSVPDEILGRRYGPPGPVIEIAINWIKKVTCS